MADHLRNSSPAPLSRLGSSVSLKSNSHGVTSPSKLTELNQQPRSSLQQCWMLCHSGQRRESAVVLQQIGSHLLEAVFQNNDESCYSAMEDVSSGLLKALISLLEGYPDNSVISCCVRLVNGFLNYARKGKRRRCQALVASEAPLSLMKCIIMCSKRGCLSVDTMKALFQVVILLGNKDKKFGTRVRVSGFLRMCCLMLVKQSPCDPLTASLLAVISLSCQSAVRNIGVVSRHSDVDQFVLKTMESVAKNDVLVCRKALELLYFISKPKRQKQRLLARDVISLLLELFERYYNAAFGENNTHGIVFSTRKELMEIPLVVLSCLRVLTKTKSGRDTLLYGNGFVLCENLIRRSFTESSSTMKSLILDGVCALCLRCLPTVPCPLDNLEHSLTYPLNESPKQNAVRRKYEENQSDSEAELNDDDLGVSDVEEMNNDNGDYNTGSGINARKLQSKPMLGGRLGDSAGSKNGSMTPIEKEFSLLERTKSNLAMHNPKSLFPAAKQYLQLVEEVEHFFPEFELIMAANEEAHDDDDESESRRGSLAGTDERRDSLQRDSPLNGMAAGSAKKSTTSAKQQRRSKPASVLVGSPTRKKLPLKRPVALSGRNIDAMDLSINGSSLMRAKAAAARSGGGRRKKSSLLKNKTPTKMPMRRSRVVNPLGEKTRGGMKMKLNRAVSFTLRQYELASQRTKSVVPFVKLSYPDMHGLYPDLPLQPQREFRTALRHQVLRQIEHQKSEKASLLDSRPVPKVVYDLDALIKSHPFGKRPSSPKLKNHDEECMGMRVPPPTAESLPSELNADGSLKDDSGSDRANDPSLWSPLKFESRFESGNLRRAVQVGPYEYELYVSADINQLALHFQWFYFEVSNMESDIPYTFHLVNFVKSSSQFSQGMQPVVFSVREAMAGRPGWARSGQGVTYYRNRYSRPATAKGARLVGAEGKNFFSLSFTLAFRHEFDVCYLAYHYPYTYTMLQAQLSDWHKALLRKSKDIYYRQDTLCRSLCGNAVPLLTITANGSPEDFDNRQYIVLSSRVHPGETNASWMMHGSIKFLLGDSPQAKEAREMYIFKVIPILNPDGVINGSHRCSLAGQDLNRQWIEPSPQFHPTIYYTKALLNFLKTSGKPPLVFCDYHGHSKMKNVFMFGNDPKESWWPPDRKVIYENDHKMLPDILNDAAPAFSLANCRFCVEKSKESTARIVAWRQFGIARSYTMESSYCGFDEGPYKSNQIGTKELMEMGEKLCESLVELKRRLDADQQNSEESADEDSDSEFELEHFSKLNYDSD